MYELDILLEPTFHASQRWNAVGDHHECAISAWIGNSRLSCSLPAHLAPHVHRLTGQIANATIQEVLGYDGISVTYRGRHNETGHFEQKVWCPSMHQGFNELTHIIWSCLHGNDRQADSALECLYTYFEEWGAPIFKQTECVKISGMLSYGDEQALQDAFQYVVNLPTPVIDMSNFENMGAVLIPLFRNFHQQYPNVQWRLNPASERFLSQLGIRNHALPTGNSPDGLAGH